MSLHKLKHFLSVVDEGGFGRAAARLHIAQPALSQSVQRLERELGLKLFERSGRGVVLTPAGRAFIEEARNAVLSYERATGAALAAANPTRVVRLGVITPSLWEPLNAILTLAQEMDLTVELEEGTTPALLEQLEAGRLHASFVSPPFTAPARLKLLPVADEPLVLALPRSMAALSDDEAFRAASERLIMFPKDYGPVLYESVLNLFRGRGLNPSIRIESPRMLTTLALISADVGAAIIGGALARNLSVEGVSCRSVGEGPSMPRWSVALAHLPLSSSAPAAQLIGACRRLWSREDASAA